MKKLLVIGLLLLAGTVAAEESTVLKPGRALGVSVSFDKRLAPASIHSLQYFGGTLSCEMAPPGTETGVPCPEFSGTFAVKENLGTDLDLEKVLRRTPGVNGEESPKNFWLDPDRKLRYRSGGFDFSLDISSYFLPGTVIHHQWRADAAHSDLLFLVAETCDEILDCRSALWFFSILRDTTAKSRRLSFKPSLVPLLGQVDWQKLEKGQGFGLHAVGERFVILLPVTGAGTPVIAWAANFRDSWPVGVVELRFDVYPAEWAANKE